MFALCCWENKPYQAHQQPHCVSYILECRSQIKTESCEHNIASHLQLYHRKNSLCTRTHPRFADYEQCTQTSIFSASCLLTIFRLTLVRMDLQKRKKVERF